MAEVKDYKVGACGWATEATFSRDAAIGRVEPAEADTSDDEDEDDEEEDEDDTEDDEKDEPSKVAKGTLR